MSKLENKTALIIGGTGGIGSALTKDFVNEGAKVMIFSRNDEKLKKIKSEFGENVEIFEGDAVSEDDLKAAVKATKEKFSKIDILVHAVGSIVLKPLQSTSKDIFNKTLELNLISPFLSIQSVLPEMLKNKSGSVVVISSVAGSKGLNNHEAISAAKGGLESMIRSAAMTYAKKGIRFNTVALGLVDTPLAEFLTKNDLSRKASENLHPMGRIGKPEEIVAAIRYLASDESAWTTGTTIHVDGGMAAN